MQSSSTTLAATQAWQPKALFALLLGYLALFGVLVGAQGVLWAEVIAALGLSKSLFGTVQLASPLLAVVLLTSSAQLAHRFGKKALALAGLALLAGSNLALAAAAGLAGLIGALLLAGAGFALLEAAANGTALDLEHATGRNVMNLIHAAFSAGAVVGAFVAGLLLDQAWRYPAVLALLATLCALVLLASLPIRFAPAEHGDAEPPGALASLRMLFSMRPVLVLAVLCVLGVVGESVATLWSVIYLRDLGANALLGGATFALFNGTMFAARLANAWVVARWGARASLLISGAALILATALLLPGNLALAIAGFALMGLGTAGVVPTVLSAGAALAPGQSAVVTGAIMAVAYTAFIICPPITGWVADLVSLRAALLVVGLSGLGLLALGKLVRSA